MQITIRNIVTADGYVFRADRTIEVQNLIKCIQTINAGKAGTAGAAGVMTLGSGHGLTDAHVVCVKWETGVRYNCTISSYDGTTVTVAGGVGDTLPTSGEVVVAVKQQIDVAFLGTNLAVLSIGADVACQITFEDDQDAVHLAKSIAEDSAYQWDEDCGETNPITGDSIVSLNVYNTTAVAGTLQGIIGYNND